MAIQWGLRRVGIDPIPPARTIERVLERGGVAQPRRRRPEQYQSRHVPYPTRVAPKPGTTRNRITLAEKDIHPYVTAIIKVRSRKLIVIDINGEIIHHSDFNLSCELR